MTKEITKANILQELQDKFQLREFDRAVFLFDETVVPVYNIAPHLEKTVRKYTRLSITSAASVTCFTVPQDERWRLRRYNVIFVTGVYTVAGILVGRPSAAEYSYLDLKAAQNASYINDLPKDVILNPGESLYVNVDGYTSTGNLDVICEVIREEIR